MKVTIATAVMASTVAGLPSFPRSTHGVPQAGAVAKVVAVNHYLFGNPVMDKTVDVPFGRLTHVADTPITELQLVGAVVTVPGQSQIDASKITCQRYNDQYGTKVGSAPFTTSSPALISTNPVDFGWVLCYVHA